LIVFEFVWTTTPSTVPPGVNVACMSQSAALLPVGSGSTWFRTNSQPLVLGGMGVSRSLLVVSHFVLSFSSTPLPVHSLVNPLATDVAVTPTSPDPDPSSAPATVDSTTSRSPVMTAAMAKRLATARLPRITQPLQETTTGNCRRPSTHRPYLRPLYDAPERAAKPDRADAVR
jgi:hypothetical protein